MVSLARIKNMNSQSSPLSFAELASQAKKNSPDASQISLNFGSNNKAFSSMQPRSSLNPINFTENDNMDNNTTLDESDMIQAPNDVPSEKSLQHENSISTSNSKKRNAVDSADDSDDLLGQSECFLFLFL